MMHTSQDLRPIREPVPLPEPGSDVGLALRTLMQTFRQCVDSTLRANGLDGSFTQGMVLKALAREPGLSGAQLARRVMITAQSMNSLLHGMESTGLAVREKHPENRRTDCWFMTRAGYHRVEQVSDLIEGIIARMLASLSKPDAARLSDLLQQCAAALQSSGTEKPARPRRPAARARASGSSRKSDS